jgi:hypothetical protein
LSFFALSSAAFSRFFVFFSCAFFIASCFFVVVFPVLHEDADDVVPLPLQQPRGNG